MSKTYSLPHSNMSMKRDFHATHFFITGATGLIGIALVEALLNNNAKITALSRSPHLAKTRFPQVHWVSSLNDIDNFDAFDGVIHLAGEGIFNQRWCAKQKQILRQSRLDLTDQLVKRINQSKNPVRFFCASAGGFYGDQKNKKLTENASKGVGFTADLCDDWETLAKKAKGEVVLLRFATVLSPNGGALQKMLPLFKKGLGSRLGDGKQYWSWISLEDCVQAILFLWQSSVTGAVNITSPEPLPQKIFAEKLAYHCQRSLFIPAPKIGIFLLFSERAKLLLDSQRLYPNILLEQGFSFQHPTFESYLKSQANFLELR